jgi:leucyl aminopeptidase
MEIAVVRTDCTEHETPLLVVQIFEGGELDGPAAKVDEGLGGQISRLMDAGDFKGKESQWVVLYPGESFPAARVMLVGLGRQETLDLERLRRASAAAVKQARKIGVDRMSTIVHHAELAVDRITPRSAARAVAEGAILGSYQFTEYKTPEGDDSPTHPATVEILEKVAAKAEEIEGGVRVGAALARAENVARTLGNLPGNVATPRFLASRADEIGNVTGLAVTVLDRAELAREGLRMLLAVSQGSAEDPCLIVMEHRGAGGGGKPLVIVGKGLTFDSGGISIKPAQGMEEMKFDMCGGAAVIGAMQAIGELQVPLDVIGIVPAAENLISGRALKPGDIVRSHLGKTVEIINTDAEGRLILADALSYARRYEPAAVVDVATLTGSCVIALGHHAAGGFTNDDTLLAEIRAAGDRVGQRVWPLPMFDEYRDQIKSEYADIKNSGGRPAGAVTAAWFLREFVGDVPWVHLDIAGTAYGEGKLPYHVKGSTGAPTRLLVEWVLARASPT